MNNGDPSFVKRIKQLLERNNLPQPNGQPLYQYQLVEAEYTQLKGALHKTSAPARSELDQAFCAAFCLFCAEWFRREYQGGWSWEPIWQQLGYKVDANDRGYVVKKGLSDYWQREVSQFSDDRNSYLGSVCREGGLPFQLLSSGDGRFQEVFKSILSNYDKAKLMGHSIRQLVASHLQNMPEALRQSTTVDLVAEMADRLVYLVEQYGLAEQQEPATYLDQQQPGWRRLFPIPLDGNTGSDFLTGLLSSATKNRGGRLKESGPIACRQFLLSSSQINFQAEVTLAKSLNIQLTRDQLSSGRVELHVAEGNRGVASLGVAYVQFEEGKTKILPRKRVCEFTRKDPQQGLTLLIKQAGQTLLSLPIEGSQLALGEVPVGLREKDGQWLVVGSASFSYKAEQLLVVLAKSAALKVDQATVHREEVRGDFQLVYFSGTLGVEIDDDQYRLSSQSNASFTDQVNVDGLKLPYATHTGQPVYLGMPEIRCNDPQAQLWVGQSRHLGAQSAASYGVQTVKLKSPEGLTLFHKRLAILPSDFSLSLEPGNKPNQGSIALKTAHNLFAQLERDERFEAKQVKQGSSKRFDLLAHEMPPAHIYLSVFANLEATPIRLQVPFPAQGVLAFDARGSALPRELVIEELLGSRLQLFPGPQGRGNYLLELVADTRVQGANFVWVHHVTDKPKEISLYELRDYIRELFAVTPDDLDALVRIRISGEGRDQNFEVRRYASVVESNELGINIPVDHMEEGLSVKPVLIELMDPKAAHKSLTPRTSQGVETGCFEPVSIVDSPCLIVPAKGSDLSFRAKFLPGKNLTAVPLEITSLYKAVELFHPVERPNIILDVMGLMAKDVHHSGWQYLIDLFESYGYLPLSTFEVWKAMAKHEEALCLLAFKLEQAPKMMERLQQEFNVLWEWLPLSVWRSAYQTYIAYWVGLGLPDEAFALIKKSKLEQLSVFSPLFNEGCQELLDPKHSSSEVIPKQVMSQVAQAAWYQDLMRLHTDNNKWPEAFSSKLERWYQGLQNKPLDLDIHMPFHRSVVLLPIFAAAVVTGKEPLGLIRDERPVNAFLLRQILEFDRNWFMPVYQYCLTAFAGQE